MMNWRCGLCWQWSSGAPCSRCGSTAGDGEGLATPPAPSVPPNSRTFPHYFKPTNGATHVDVYWVLQAWGVTNPAVQHAVKKLLVAGGRGAKDRTKDMNEAIASVQRALELEP